MWGFTLLQWMALCGRNAHNHEFHKHLLERLEHLFYLEDLENLDRPESSKSDC